MNYQYANGLSTTAAMRTLYADGGVPRFYRGLGVALIQGPLSRGMDTLANDGVLALMNGRPSTQNLPVIVKTLAASATAAGARILLMPVDAVKTTLQVHGKDGYFVLRNRVRAVGVRTLWAGSMGTVSSTFAGHWPWFATYNYLNEKVPQQETLGRRLGRNAGIGFISSAVSDSISNSLRVLKTTKQTAKVPIAYPEAARRIIASDGVIGLMGRGLKTRLLANGMQGAMFSVAWRYFESKFSGKA